ncbi:uncharacterized protein LOC143523365 isoform X1 [Brachyhypopomus gauderio]|uniref:uncharacterized protein LOC143523365 isoform X1 n=1 Tax=Brachyhypopomus gauderio TaxID=698409 RepID=UPI0040413B0C
MKVVGWAENIHLSRWDNAQQALPPQQPATPTKWGRKQIRIQDPNQGGRDITEEMISGGHSLCTPTGIGFFPWLTDPLQTSDQHPHSQKPQAPKSDHRTPLQPCPQSSTKRKRRRNMSESFCWGSSSSVPA